MIPSPRITTPSNSVRFTPPTQDGLDDSGASGLVSLKRPALTPPDQDRPRIPAPLAHRSTPAPHIPSHRRSRLTSHHPRRRIPMHTPIKPSPRHKTLLQQVVHPPPEPAQQTLADATFALPGQVVLIAGAALDDTVDVALGRSRIELERLGRSRSSLVALS